ncbi:MAG: enolase C-terminal domain-like protein, partial [Acidobacteriota bacterium]
EAGTLRLALGVRSHDTFMARRLVDHGGVGVIQIDTGRIGGIGPAKEIADYAVKRGITFVNHTFASHLALSASVQPYAGLESHELCEFSAEPKALAFEIISSHLMPHADGLLRRADAPGLGMAFDPHTIKRYLGDVEISAKGKTLYRAPRSAA